HGFHTDLAERPVARLAAVQQTLFGGQERAFAVDVDGAAFEHDAGAPAPELQRDGEPGLLVALVIFIARPAVELPFHERGLALFAATLDQAERQKIAR